MATEDQTNGGLRRPQDRPDSPVSRRSPRRAMTVYRAGWVTAFVVVTLVGAGAAVRATPGAFFMVAALAGWGLLVWSTSPSAVRAYGRWLRSVPAPSAARLDAVAQAFAHAGVGYVWVPPSPDPLALSDEELRERWRTSCRYLQQPLSMAQVLRAVEQRGRDLDELERRYPGVYAAWLTSAARSLDHLTPDAIEGPSDQAPINWDELTLGRD